jgi:flagellar basal-body rod protein FlgB
LNARTLVPDISDAQLMATLRQAMTVASARQVVSASNLANVNTPGYKARELAFDAALDEQLGTGLTVTNARHLQAGGGAAAGAMRETEGLQARRDGNTVQIDQELLHMTRASGEFARAQTALAAKFRLVKYAISESR